MNNTELKKARAYFDIEDDLPESRGYISDVLQQTKQIPMQSIGGVGNLARSGARAAQIIGAMQEQEYPQKGESLSEQPDISQSLPLPSPESIGRSLGYREPVTLPGRIAKPIASATGSAIPIAATVAAGGGLGAAVPLLKAGAYGGLAKGITKELGASEGISDVAELITSLSVGARKALEKSIKPSGLTQRTFETEPKSMLGKIAKSPNISKEQYDKLKETIEDEISNLSGKMLSKNQNYTAIKNAPGKYYADLDKGLDKVEELAYMVPGRFNSREILNKLKKIETQHSYTPISPSASDKAYKQYLSELAKDIDPTKDYLFRDLLKKYRANWKDHTGMFSSSATSAEIEGRRAAVADFNKVLSEVMGEKAPGSQFNKLFKLYNKGFTDKANVEKIDAFLNDIFSGNKINFNKAKDYFKDEPLKRGIRISFGADTEKKFSQLIKDLLSQEKGMKRLRPREAGSGISILSPQKWARDLRGIIQRAPVVEPSSMKKMAPYVISQAERQRKENKGIKTVEDILSE